LGVTVTVPADTKTPGTAGHTSDHNVIVDAITALSTSVNDTVTEFGAGVLLDTATPGTPASGKCVLYSSAQGTPTVKSDSGLASPLPAVQTDATVFSLTNPLAFAAISKAWTIPAGDASAGTVYSIEMNINGLWEASGAFNIGWQLDATNTNFVPVAAAAFTAAHNYTGVFRFYLQVLTTGAGGTHQVYADGTLSDTTAARLPATSLTLNAINTGSIDTTVSHTLAIIADFSATNASQTVKSTGSIFKRLGN